MSPGPLSFAKLAMMSSAPAKSSGMPDTRPKIQSFNQRCPIQSRLQSVLGMRPFYVERNYFAGEGGGGGGNIFWIFQCWVL